MTEECGICGAGFDDGDDEHDGCAEHCTCDACRSERYTGPRDSYDDGDEIPY